MTSYILVINNIPTDNAKLEFKYNTNSEDSKKTFDVNDNNEKETWTCTLQNLSYSKAIYKPGELQFNLQLTGCKNVNKIYQTFKEKTVTLISKENDKTNNISKDYYIFGIRIQKRSDIFYITVQAFDPFKYLTLDNYCKAYTGKKFILDILWNTDLWPKKLPTAIKKTQFTLEKSIRNKAVLEQKKKTLEWIIANLNDQKNKENKKPEKERDEKKIKELENKIHELEAEDRPLETTKKEINATTIEGSSVFNITPQLLHYHNGIEFIQPYLVQYNESFFDFLVRVSNRCGEFLYYEDGYFNIGWDKDTKVKTPITEYVAINFAQNVTTACEEDSISSVHNDYTTNENKKDSKSAAKMYDSNLASDENLASIPPKDEYTQWTDFALFPGCYFINIFTDIANSANVAEALTNLVFSTTATTSASAVFSKNVNDEYEKKYFDPNKAYIKERQNGERIHPFSTSNSNTTTVKSSESNSSKPNSYIPFSLEFYEAVRKGIEKNEQSRIQIALGTHFYPLSLGSLIELDNQTYIVVQINGCVNNETETLDIEAIPYSEGNTVFPPAAPVNPIREAKAQRAFITDNLDPLKMNRVRVRYPWQATSKDSTSKDSTPKDSTPKDSTPKDSTSKDSTPKDSTPEDSTPWIRIALPMASNDCGFNFLPQIGDEAIINYENGNIERPYVEGMLYTGKSSVPYDFKQNNARVISSVNGHSIIFSDPPVSTNAINGLFPLWKTINSFVPSALKGKDLKEYNKKAMGGIEFTDEHGLYSISMSSDKRTISIDSPVGKVDINAFTGITISAPNGNVRIEGKNIDIVAGNNLSISSGNNIASHFWHMRDSKWGEGGKDFLQTLGTSFLSKVEIIDMNLIRTIFETLLRPCAGTLLIKSNRYLCFEAGKGEAQIAGRQTVKQLGIRKTSDLTFAPDQICEVTIPYQNNVVVTNRIPIHINNVIQAIEAAEQAFRTINTNLLSAKNAYIDAFKTINRIPRSNEYIKNGSQLPDFDSLYPANIDNFTAFQMVSEIPADGSQTEFLSTKIFLNKLNKHALNIKENQLTSNKILNDFKNVYLQDPIVKELIDNYVNIDNDITKLYRDFITQSYFNRRSQSCRTKNKRELLYNVLVGLINRQNGTEAKGAAYNNVNKIALEQNTNWAQWDTWCNSLKYEPQSPVQLRKRDKARLGMTEWKFLGVHKLNGMLDQYIWDTNEDAGKILFSDQAGETLNFHNKEIHYYKKSETDPLTALKNILRRIQ